MQETTENKYRCIVVCVKHTSNNQYCNYKDLLVQIVQIQADLGRGVARRNNEILLASLLIANVVEW